MILEQHGPTDFVGYKANEATAKVLYCDGDSVILDRSPFYAEAGGQIGDRGTISGENGSALIKDTVYGAVGQHLHVVESIKGELTTGDKVVGAIDISHRLAVQRHHTGTHLLHWALRQVLGDHVKQQGSWVGAERLRFDFSHFEIRFEVIHRQRVTSYRGVCVVILVRRDGVGNVSMRVLEDVADDASVLSIVGDVVFVVVISRHNQLNFLVIRTKRRRRFCAKYRTTRDDDDAKKGGGGRGGG